MQNKKWKSLCLLLGLCIFMTSACGFGGKNPNGEEPPVQEETGEPAQSDTPSAKEEQPLPDETDKKTEEKQENGEKAVENRKNGEKQGGQTKPFWQSETSMHIQNLTAVADAAETDYKVNGPKRGWMTKNGRLYGYYDGSYVTPSTLVKDGYLESGLDTDGYEILLINGSDLAELDGANVPAESMGFVPFAAVKQSGKYLLASSAGKAGQISEESYNGLLAKYNQSHGTIGRLSSASAEYDRILNFISLYEGKFESYFVREIRKDNKYAVVTFSGTANTAAVKQYILKNDSNFWEVVYPNVQMDSYPITYINKLVPDFNVSLLPGYNLASWKSYIKAEQGGAVAALFSGRYISSINEIMYQCATADCAYFRLRDGSRYAVCKEGDVWKAQPVSSDNAAKNYFMEKTGVDYGFIILDD